MVGVCEKTLDVLLPTERSEDLERVRKALGVPDGDQARLVEMLSWEICAIQKKTLSVRVESQSQAAAMGFEDAFVRARREYVDWEIWWQKWDGLLYAFSVDNGRVQKVPVEKFVGEYEVIFLR